jgi:hypothetical protein
LHQLVGVVDLSGFDQLSSLTSRLKIAAEANDLIVLQREFDLLLLKLQIKKRGFKSEVHHPFR